MKSRIFVLFLFIILGISNVIADSIYSNYTKWEVDSKGKKKGKSEYFEFDKYGNTIKRIQYLSNNTQLTDSFSYVIIEGKLIEKLNFHNNSLFCRKVYKYNTFGKIESITDFDKNSIRENFEKHSYIGFSEIIENFTEKMDLYSIDTLVYNEKNLLISHTQYLSDGDWFTRHNYEYNDKNNLIKSQSEANPEFDGIGIVEYFYEINIEGKPTKEIVKFPDGMIEYYIYEYSKI
ncbi:MAG: hypothetical protein WCK02_06015 [Bacteroidota bacterium]